MTSHDISEDRDEVLFAFHQACNSPTAEQIIDWTTRYPQFAEDIRAHAAYRKDWAAREGMPVDEPDEVMLARGRSVALNALYNAEVEAVVAAPSTSHATFQELMAARGTDVRRLSTALGIERGILADLVSGRMLAPVGKRFFQAVSQALAISRDAFDAAHQFALQAPKLGHAKADHTPTVILRSYEEIVRSSSMTDDERRYWLDGD
jgi:hypothetical protein